jgi:hypothetical protein
MSQHYVKDASGSTIERMTDDLGEICNHLQMHYSLEGEAFEPWHADPGERTTWFYKAPQPGSVANKSAPSAQKRKRPPKSSPSK